MSSDLLRGRLIRGKEQKAVCPPKHELTQSRALINRAAAGAGHVELYLVEIQPGGAGFDDIHPDCEHGFIVIGGEGEAFVEGERFSLKPEDALFIPKGANHSVKTIGEHPFKMIVFMAPHRLQAQKIEVSEGQ